MVQGADAVVLVQQIARPVGREGGYQHGVDERRVQQLALDGPEQVLPRRRVRAFGPDEDRRRVLRAVLEGRRHAGPGRRVDAG